MCEGQDRYCCWLVMSCILPTAGQLVNKSFSLQSNVYKLSQVLQRKKYVKLGNDCVSPTMMVGEQQLSSSSWTENKDVQGIYSLLHYFLVRLAFSFFLSFLLWTEQTRKKCDRDRVVDQRVPTRYVST